MRSRVESGAAISERDAARPMLERAAGFLRKPWREKARSLAFRWIRAFPGAAWPVRLPGGDLWFAEYDHLGTALLAGEFESGERQLLERLLQPGMTVLDIGAHHGLYTLLASRKVEPGGRVIAFEPSPRERRRLERHLRWNGRRNVKVASEALGETAGEAELYLAERAASVCNSLRPPAEPARERVRVRVARLDEWLEREGIERVDAVKLDVEGAERSVLRGAERLLERRPRPLILAEVSDRRTRAWNYPAREIVGMLAARGFAWFAVGAAGRLERADTQQAEWDGNYLAVPEERLEEVAAQAAQSAAGGRMHER